MFPVYDVDAFLLLAIALSSKRRPAALAEIIAAGDMIQGAECSELELVGAFQRLSVHGLISEVEGGFLLTPDAQQILTGKKKAEAHQRVAGIKENLAAYNPKAEHPAVSVTALQLSEAVQAHQLVRQSAGKNLLMPKPKREPALKRQGQRKPYPSRRR